ncbi:MAG: hypothetical protein ABJH98_11565 [Reichenbachiella sp.]|uniref:hypothetical protein n=1 Tax=Reichenbachiella sp. TaxID=2184521 RepID=UPI003297FD65
MRQKTQQIALWLSVVIISYSCATIAYYDANSFKKTAELKAKTLVLVGHADENYNDYVKEIDEVKIMAEELYSLQKARDINHATIGQWKKLMEKDPATNKSVFPDFFEMWKSKGSLSNAFIDPAKTQFSEIFDEILKLESSKNKKQ